MMPRNHLRPNFPMSNHSQHQQQRHHRYKKPNYRQPPPHWQPHYHQSQESPERPSTYDPNNHTRREPVSTTKVNYVPNFHIANIESLTTRTAQYKKIPFLREECSINKPYFLAFAESHLKDNIKDAEFHMPNYSYAASHRQRGKRGGLLSIVILSLHIKL